MGPILGGNVHLTVLDDWEIEWEVSGEYRHWCTQVPTYVRDAELVVVQVFNPGSIKGGGQTLRSDVTLGWLRNVFHDSRFGCAVINLFDYATPDPGKLFENWQLRDRPGCELAYRAFPQHRVVARLAAYGDFENHPQSQIAVAVRERIAEMNKVFGHLPAIPSPKNKSGTPKHVRRWQLENLGTIVSRAIRDFSAACAVK